MCGLANAVNGCHTDLSINATGGGVCYVVACNSSSTGGFNYVDNLLVDQNGWQGLARVDVNISDNTKMFLRYNVQREVQPFVIGLWLSTLYLRHHYFVDLLAGWLLAPAAVWVAPRVDAWWARQQRALGYEPARGAGP